jgi:hypothetical protein
MISAWESLYFATLELVHSTPIKQRLISAYRRHLIDIKDDQVPGEIRDSFCRLKHSLSCVSPLRGEDSVAASVRKMSNQEADDCAAQIVEIFGMTCRVLLSAARASASVVQLHRESDAERETDERELTDFEAPALIANQ